MRGKRNLLACCQLSIGMWLALLASQGFIFAQNAPTVAPSYQWTTEKWSGDDAPYTATRRALEGASQQELKTHIAKTAPVLAKPNPAAKTVFLYGYAAYLLATKLHTPDSEQPLAAALRAMERSKSPDTYNYARLHFLLVARRGPFAPLRDVGIRLAQKDASDYDVRYYLNNLLKPGVKNEDKVLALRLCQQMIQLDPKRPSAHAALGWTYFRSWLTGKKPDDAEKSIAAYRKYLQLAPANDTFRPQAQSIIAMMQKK